VVVVVALPGCASVACIGCCVIAGVVAAGFGFEFNGAPTLISQRCPGCPCAGFIPGAVAVVEAVAVAGAIVPGGKTVLDDVPFMVTGIPFCGLTAVGTVVSAGPADLMPDDGGTTVLSTADTSLAEPELQEEKMIPTNAAADKILFIKIPRFE
jgi:hypothetical protein